MSEPAYETLLLARRLDPTDPDFAGLDLELLPSLERCSFFHLTKLADQQAPLAPDMQLAKTQYNFYPNMMAYMKVYEKAAYNAQMQSDVYGFLAKITVVVGSTALPLTGCGLMLLPTWNHQLAGTSLVVSIRAEQARAVGGGVLQMANDYSRIQRRSAHMSPLNYDFVNVVENESGDDVVRERILAVSQIFLYSGVSCLWCHSLQLARADSCHCGLISCLILRRS